MMGRKKTNQESQAFKHRIVELKRKRRTATEIASELGVTKQYVSLVLIRAGLTSKGKRALPRKTKDTRTDMMMTIARLEQQGEAGLAAMLETILGRRTKIRKTKG